MFDFIKKKKFQLSLIKYKFQEKESKDNLFNLWNIYCKFSDNEIIKKNKNLIAINHYFLNPVKPNYFNLKILKDIEFLSIKDILKLKFRFYVNFLKIFLRHINIFRNRFSINLKLSLIRNYDYVIVTHLNNKDRLTSPFDPYYGNLLEGLIKNRKKVLLVFFPHIHLNKLEIERYKKIKKTYDVYFLSQNYSDGNIKLKDIKLFFNERKRLLEKSKIFNGFLKNLYIYAAETVLSSDNQKNWNYANELYQVIKHSSAKNLITTYEGHSWEGLFYYFTKKASSKVRCIGYQHTLLFEYNHSTLREISSLYDPDLILASGETTLKLLNKKISKRIRIELIGSHKHKINHKDSINISKKILFLPSGEFEEALIMTKFAINYAKFNPKVNITIRYHPIIENKFNHLKESKNFKKSESSIINDCEKSRWALYSSSTAIFEAIQLGCMPIKLNIKNLISINDPLWQIDSELINTVENMNELSLLINGIRDNEKNELSINKKYRLIIEQINNLRSSLNTKIILEDFQ